MLRVLQISMGKSFRGAEKIQLEYFRHLHSKFKFDFLCASTNAYSPYQNEIYNLNGNIYELYYDYKNVFSKFSYYLKLCKFLKQHKYDIIHIHSSAFLYSFVIGLIARIYKIPKIIVHSHNPHKINKFKRFIITILNPIYRVLANEYIACSKTSASALFTDSFINKNNVTILKNGIEISKYKFNLDIRNSYREKYKLNNKIVYGNIGYFEKTKNHEQLIDIFYEIHKKQKNSILLLVGEGDLKNNIIEKVKTLNLQDNVIFIEFSNEANNLLNCMDYFLFPSLYEGLGLALIEAQTNGLTSFCSDTIPVEAFISPYIKSFSLNESNENIANYILTYTNPLEARNLAYKYTIQNNYDINNTCTELELIYKKADKK